MNSPNYYKTANGGDVFSLLEHDELFSFAKGNVLKYVIRAGRKPGEEAIKDLSKALHYLQVMVETLKSVQDEQGCKGFRPAGEVEHEKV